MRLQNEYYRKRTQDFAVEVVRTCDNLPKTTAANVMAKREKFSELSIVVEEADETVGWLEMIMPVTS